MRNKKLIAATPAYVVSANEQRWQRARQILASLNFEAERVKPAKPSFELSKELCVGLLCCAAGLTQ